MGISHHISYNSTHVEILEDMTAFTFINNSGDSLSSDAVLKLLVLIGVPILLVQYLRSNAIIVDDGPVYDYLSKQRTTWIFNPFTLLTYGRR